MCIASDVQLSVNSFNIIAEFLGPFRFVGHVDPLVSLRSEIYARLDSVSTLINQSSELLKSTLPSRMLRRVVWQKFLPEEHAAYCLLAWFSVRP
jgi:hypothetical protein